MPPDMAGISYYSGKTAGVEIVDVACIEGVVGRVEDIRNRWQSLIGAPQRLVFFL
jgi:tetrahydromethanopterin S-methyltransferase subunit F